MRKLCRAGGPLGWLVILWTRGWLSVYSLIFLSISIRKLAEGAPLGPPTYSLLLSFNLIADISVG